MKNSPHSQRVIVALLCLLLFGCAPEGFKSREAWQAACIRQGGEPMWIKVYNGSTFLCLSRSAIVEVKP